MWERTHEELFFEVVAHQPYKHDVSSDYCETLGGLSDVEGDHLEGT